MTQVYGKKSKKDLMRRMKMIRMDDLSGDRMVEICLSRMQKTSFVLEENLCSSLLKSFTPDVPVQETRINLLKSLIVDAFVPNEIFILEKWSEGWKLQLIGLFVELTPQAVRAVKNRLLKFLEVALVFHENGSLQTELRRELTRVQFDTLNFLMCSKTLKRISGKMEIPLSTLSSRIKRASERMRKSKNSEIGSFYQLFRKNIDTRLSE